MATIASHGDEPRSPGMHEAVCGLRVGMPAPELAAETLAARGMPRVLAFAAAGAFGEAGEAALAPIRAHLRGLGAELLVLQATGAWRLRADDALAALGDEIDVDTVAARHGVPAGRDAVFVIDGRGVVRFAQLAALGDAVSTLGTALAIAGDAVHTRDTRRAPDRVLFTRREWNVTCLVVGFASALAGCKQDRPPPGERPPAPVATAPRTDLVDVTLTINGKPHRLSIDPRASLLDTLRETLGLTGTKKGCDAGQCGACTVLLGGTRITACLTLAVMAQGKDVTTIEGLASGGALHPMQQAFIAHDGLQCGYCTPGQILSAVALLRENRARTDDEVREQMSGNLCRCGAYPNIVAAIQAARRPRG